MKIKKDEVGWLLLFIAPTLILFTLFFILPILFLLASSFTNWDGISAEFVGFENYIKLFNKKSFVRAITNNLYWCITAALITRTVRPYYSITLISSIKRMESF